MPCTWSALTASRRTRDGQPDHLGQDEKDHEEHDLAAPALCMRQSVA